MSQQATSARAVARRRAREVSARRKAEAEAREAKICALLARYFESAEHAARYQARTAEAVGDLLQVTGTITDVAGLCGITVPAARNLAAVAATDAKGKPDGSNPQLDDAARVPGGAETGPRRPAASNEGDRVDAEDGQAGRPAGTG